MDPAVVPHLRRQRGAPPASRAGLYLGNLMQALAMPKPKVAEPWWLTSLREKVIKICAKVVSHVVTSRSKWPRWRCRERRLPRFCP
jgi:hypothetical protein